ncbi:hypothetical protein ACVBEH_34105, partial [Roseateles sp. GG27B]
INDFIAKSIETDRLFLDNSILRWTDRLSRPRGSPERKVRSEKFMPLSRTMKARPSSGIAVPMARLPVPSD